MVKLSKNQLLRVVQSATLAPSIYNTQPWLFNLSESSIKIYPDPSRHLLRIDPAKRELHMSLGCALENAIIELRSLKFRSDVSVFSHPQSEDALRLDISPGELEIQEPFFLEAIQKRNTNLSHFENRVIPRSVWARLERIALDEGVQVLTFSEPDQALPWIDWVSQADRIQFNDSHFQEELLSWTRFNESEMQSARDGLRVNSIGIPIGLRWLGSFFLRHYHFADYRARRDEELIRNSSGLVLFLTKSDHRESWVRVGRTFQRWILVATHLGLQHSYLNQVTEVPGIRSMIQEKLDLKGFFPQLLIRVGYADSQQRSIRRPLDDVIIQDPFLRAAS